MITMSMSQLLDHQAREYLGLTSEQLVNLTNVTSKRASQQAKRAEAREVKKARDDAIDARAKEARHADMERALAEPADCGRYQRGKKRKGARVSTQRSQRRRASLPAALVDIDESSEETEVEEEDGVPAAVMVDGEEEWVVDRITGSRHTKFQTERGEWDWVTEYEVHWVGGEVTWEPREVVEDCAALDDYERLLAARNVKQRA